MTYAYWYLLVAMLMPYVFAILAKSHPHYNNRSPRDFLETLEGWRKRSHYVQLNTFEIFPAFATAVIIAHLTNAPQQSIDVIALIFVILRVLYGVLYISNQPALRSLTWLGSLVCIISLFVISA